MLNKRKIAVSFCVILILVGALLAGLSLYYYHAYYQRPSKMKALLERSISSSTGTVCVIDHLSYSVWPLKLEAKGIVISPGKNQQGFSLEVPDLMAEMSLIGPIGQKSLLLKVFKISSFSVRVDREAALPEGLSKDSAPSFLKELVGQLAGFLLFKEVKIEKVDVDDGMLVFESADQCVQLDGIHARLTTDRFVDLGFTARVQWPSSEMRFEASNVNIRTDDALSLAAPQITGYLEVRDGMFESAHLAVPNIALDATCAYDHRHKRLSFDPFDIRLEGARFEPEIDKRIMPKDFQLTAKGSFDLNENQVDISRFDLIGKDSLQLTGVLNAGFGTRGAIQLKGELNSSLAKNLNVSLSADDKKIAVGLDGEDINLVESLATLNLLPSGWAFSGLESLNLKAWLNEDDCSVTGKLALKDDGSIDPENIVFQGGFDADFLVRKLLEYGSKRPCYAHERTLPSTYLGNVVHRLDTDFL